MCKRNNFNILFVYVVGYPPNGPPPPGPQPVPPPGARMPHPGKFIVNNRPLDL